MCDASPIQRLASRTTLRFRIQDSGFRWRGAVRGTMAGEEDRKIGSSE
jgi:hypothetical protein